MPDEHKEVLIVIIAVTIIFLVTTGILCFIFLYYQRKRIQHKASLILLEKKYTEELLQSKLEIHEQTLKNISDEIHDNIGQILSLAKIHLGSIEGIPNKGHEEKLLVAKQLVGKAIQDLRHLSHSLNIDYIADMGLSKAIEYQLELIQKLDTYKTEYKIEGDVFRIDAQKELILFRIVQEILNNILKHAHARKINILIGYLPGIINLKISDDGKGFIVETPGKNSAYGQGIKSMQRRATLINAELTIQSAPEEGTVVDIRMSV